MAAEPPTRRTASDLWVTRVIRIARQAVSNNVTINGSDLATVVSLASGSPENLYCRVLAVRAWNTTTNTGNYITMAAQLPNLLSDATINSTARVEDNGSSSRVARVGLLFPYGKVKAQVFNSSSTGDLVAIKTGGATDHVCVDFTVEQRI